MIWNRPAESVFVFIFGFAIFGGSVAAQSAASPPEHESPSAAAETQASGAPGLTLARLQEMAVAHNPTLAQAQAEVRAAQGRVKQAGLWPNPVAGYTGEEIRGGSFGGGMQGFFVEQQILLGGKLRLNQNVFQQEQKQAEAEAEEQRLRVDNGVRIAFYQALAAQRMVELRRKLSDLAADAARTTGQLYNVGQSDQPDTLQAQVEADDAQLALLAAQQEEQRAWRVLAATAGQPRMPLAPLEGDLENVPPLDPDKALDAILRDSPAVKIAQLSVARAQAATASARRQAVPDLTLRGGFQQDREELEAGPPHRAGGIGFAEASVNIPLFNRNQGNVAAAKAEVERAQREVDRVELVLRQQAAPLVETYESSRAIVERYKTQTLPTSERAYQLYLEKYHQGAAAYPQVLIAQRTFFRLQAAYVTALESAWTSANTLQGLLLTDGLDQPSAPGTIDQPIREINLPVTETPGGGN